MLQTTPTLPKRGGPPRQLTGIINTVVGQIKVTTADQLPDQPTPSPSAATRRLTQLETAQLMKDRDEWLAVVDGFTVEEETEWNEHKERLKLIPNMSRAQKIELFGRLRRVAQAYGIGFNETTRLFYMMPLPGDDSPADMEVFHV